jgi:outer membrane protein
MAAVALLALLAAAPARAEVKLAYVDVQRALNECEAGKTAQADMRSKLRGIEQKLQSEKDDVERLKDELEKKGMLMKPEQRQNLQDEYINKAKNFDRNFKDTKEDLERKDQEITGMIIHDLAEVIRNLGEKNGYTMVMEKGSILWGTPGIDITDQVIRAYNGTHAKLGTLGGMPPMAGGGGGGDEDQHAGASSPSDFGSNAAKHSSISKSAN